MLQIHALADSDGGALEAAFDHAPYLKRLSEQVADAFQQIVSHGASAAFETALGAVSHSEGDLDNTSVALRRAKRAAHLSIAAGDLSRTWTLDEVTSAVSGFADACVEAALGASLRARGLSAEGLFVVALGKMGARELNYSSDIDVAAFYDPDVFDGGERAPGDAASRVVRDIVRLLDERTEHGYVFRTDLRLRPDPSSTPLAVSTRMAELYYESVGQNWERMVWIKARACAGDRDAARAFLDAMHPFVWRRHLDYWAIADIHAIKAMINASAGVGDLETISPDVKLGPGGIREIEFFVQTQQVILGGRNKALRLKGTRPALEALVAEGSVTAATATTLSRAYEALRHVEHRIQMRADEQTHTVPESAGGRSALAALCGWDDEPAFREGLSDVRSQVHDLYRQLFADEERRTADAHAGNLVFTGVDDDPGTLRTLSELGFSAPSGVIERIRRWHRGGTPATRTGRGRELLTAILPELLQAMGETGEADTAFARFTSFFEGLVSGVQCLSMLMAEPDLMRDLVVTLAIAPRLADILSRRPELLEVLLGAGLVLESAASGDFETEMDAARRTFRDESFLTGHRLLHGRIDAHVAAQAWTDLADRTVGHMARAALRETERRFGPAPGPWAIMAMGRFGGREMTAGSDLDLMVLFDPPGSDGGASQTWFTRFTQRVITALSAPTAEGLLYEVDMRLRPSGNAGPVAVRLAAFERYQRDEAWTWEHMALTRLRFVAGDDGLGSRAVDVARDVVAGPGRSDDITRDIADMRKRLFRDKPGKGLWDLKMAAGGLVDVEFLIQHAILQSGDPAMLASNTGEALARLSEAGHFGADATNALSEALTMQSALLQVLRLAVGAVFDAETASNALKDRLCRAVKIGDFSELCARLEAVKAAVSELRGEILQVRATES